MYLFLLVVLLPACGRKTVVKTGAESGSVTLKNDKTTVKKGEKKKLFLDDDVKELTFEEEQEAGFSPAALKDSSKLDLVVNREWEERRAEQAKQGLKAIYFDFDQYVIRPDQDAAFKKNLDSVKKLTKQGKTIVIEGHACDSAGSESYNVHLSEKRAASVKKALINQGVPADQLKTVGRGVEMCIVHSGTREQQAPNRRVEIFVLAGEQA